MAQYSITYACGHSGTVNLIGHHSGREQKLARLKSGDCFYEHKEHVHFRAHMEHDGKKIRCARDEKG